MCANVLCWLRLYGTDESGWEMVDGFGFANDVCEADDAADDDNDDDDDNLDNAVDVDEKESHQKPTTTTNMIIMSGQKSGPVLEYQQNSSYRTFSIPFNVLYSIAFGPKLGAAPPE